MIFTDPQETCRFLPGDEELRRIEEGDKDPSLYSPEICRALFDRSDEIALEDPDHGLRLARFGLTASVALGDEYGGWRGIALGVLASRLRNACDLEGSLTTIESATSTYLSDMQPLEVADLFRRFAYIYAALEAPEDALNMANIALGMFEPAEMEHTVGCGHLARGVVLMTGNRSREAFQELHKATQMLESDITALYVLEAYNYMALLLIEDEHASETDFDLAGIYLDTLNEMALFPENSMPSLMTRLTRGRLLIRLQQFEEAWGIVASARTQFWEKKRIPEWMIASLDLATVYFHQKNFALMMKTADEMLPLFEDLQKHSCLYEALQSFHRAVAQDEVTLPLLNSLRRLLVSAVAA